mgnify:CR=1 FL=1
MSNPCVKCGHDPDAAVRASWSFTIEREVKSLNDHNVNVKGWRGAVYKKDRGAWVQWFQLMRVNHRIPLATGKRVVTLTRIMGSGQREFDRDNLHGGLKSALDAMVYTCLITGDSIAHATILYDQQRRSGPGVKPGLHVLLEELAQ